MSSMSDSVAVRNLTIAALLHRANALKAARQECVDTFNEHFANVKKHVSGVEGHEKPGKVVCASPKEMAAHEKEVSSKSSEEGRQHFAQLSDLTTKTHHESRDVQQKLSNLTRRITNELLEVFDQLINLQVPDARQWRHDVLLQSRELEKMQESLAAIDKGLIDGPKKAVEKMEERYATAGKSSKPSGSE